MNFSVDSGTDLLLTWRLTQLGGVSLFPGIRGAMADGLDHPFL